VREHGADGGSCRARAWLSALLTARSRICGSGTTRSVSLGDYRTVMMMSRLRCAASTSLSGDEVHVLEEVPDPAHELELSVACELEAGHAGRHAALCQTSGAPNIDWWLRWSEVGRRDVQQLEPCVAEHSDGGDGGTEEVCELAVDHAGGHSFQLAGTPGGRTPSPAYRQKLEALMWSLP
jgi:hypothetical protein